jgi:uncharacterized protein (DUF58 family)
VALLVLIGLVKNINLLTLLGYVLLVVFALNVLLAGRRLRRLRAARALGEPIFAGSPCAVELTVQASKPEVPGRPGALTEVRLEDLGAEHHLAWFVERLAGGEVLHLHGEVALQRRGAYWWGPLVAVAGRPFGLIQRRVMLAPAREVIVLPRLGWLHRGLLRRRLSSARVPGRSVRLEGRPHPAAQEEFHGLRPFRTGDSPRAIHWRTSARRGELMVREYEDLPGEDLLLIFDPSVPATREQFESAICVAATICWEWCRQHGDRLILAVTGPGGFLFDGLSGPEHGRRLLTRLALLQPAPLAGPAGAEEDLPADLAHLAGSLSVLVVAPGPSTVGDRLGQRWQRPVTCLDASKMDEWDFYRP